MFWCSKCTERLYNFNLNVVLTSCLLGWLPVSSGDFLSRRVTSCPVGEFLSRRVTSCPVGEFLFCLWPPVPPVTSCPAGDANTVLGISFRCGSASATSADTHTESPVWTVLLSAKHIHLGNESHCKCNEALLEEEGGKIIGCKKIESASLTKAAWQTHKSRS